MVCFHVQREDAGRLLSGPVRVPRLRGVAQAQARGLLRVLFLRHDAVPAGSATRQGLLRRTDPAVNPHRLGGWSVGVAKA